MKTSFWLLVLLLIPIAVWSQERLQFQVGVTLHDTGTWSGWSKWHPDATYGGADYRTLQLRFDDTISVNGDSISFALTQFMNLSAAIDRSTNTIRDLHLYGNAPGQDGDAVEFTVDLTIDSLPFEVHPGSLLVIPNGSYPCRALSSYWFAHSGAPYALGGGSSDMTGCSGQGGDSSIVTLFVPNEKSRVTVHGKQPRIRISVANGTLLIEGDLDTAEKIIEIYNILGKTLYRMKYEGNAIPLSNFPSGCYFLRLSNEVVKFVVMP